MIPALIVICVVLAFVLLVLMDIGSELSGIRKELKRANDNADRGFATQNPADDPYRYFT